MKSDPLDVRRAIRLSKAAVTKMKQNLFWASIYSLFAIPVAAGVFYPSFGVELRPEITRRSLPAGKVVARRHTCDVRLSSSGRASYVSATPGIASTGAPRQSC